MRYTPVLLDGLALSALAGAEDLVASCTAVLAPNGGELTALLDGRDLDGEPAAIDAARRYGAVVSSPGSVAAATSPGGAAPAC